MTQNKHKATHDQLIKNQRASMGGVTFSASVVQLGKALVRLSFFFWHMRTSIHMLTRTYMCPVEVVHKVTVSPGTAASVRPACVLHSSWEFLQWDRVSVLKVQIHKFSCVCVPEIQIFAGQSGSTWCAVFWACPASWFATGGWRW